MTHFLQKQLSKQRNLYILFCDSMVNLLIIMKYNIQKYSLEVGVVKVIQPQDILHMSLLQLQNPWHANP